MCVCVCDVSVCVCDGCVCVCDGVCVMVVCVMVVCELCGRVPLLVVGVASVHNVPYMWNLVCVVLSCGVIDRTGFF